MYGRRIKYNYDMDTESEIPCTFEDDMNYGDFKLEEIRHPGIGKMDQNNDIMAYGKYDKDDDELTIVIGVLLKKKTIGILKSLDKNNFEAKKIKDIEINLPNDEQKDKIKKYLDEHAFSEHEKDIPLKMHVVTSLHVHYVDKL
jgi:hypothetical protein